MRASSLLNAIKLAVCVVGACLLASVADAQDIEAVKQRLHDSVEAGEISAAQAGVMLKALQETNRQEADAAPNSGMQLSERYRKSLEELKTLRDSGRLPNAAFESMQDMLLLREYNELRTALGDAGDRFSWDDIARTLDEAVLTGDMSMEKSDETYWLLHQWMQVARKRATKFGEAFDDAELAKQLAELKQQVNRGEVSLKDASRQFAKLLQERAANSDENREAQKKRGSR